MKTPRIFLLHFFQLLAQCLEHNWGKESKRERKEGGKEGTRKERKKEREKKGEERIN